MWPTFSSTEPLTRTRLTVAIVSMLATAATGWYIYQAHETNRVLFLPRDELHRSHAVRRRPGTRNRTTSRSTRARAVSESSLSDEQPEENANSFDDPPRRNVDGETLMDEPMDDDWAQDPNMYLSTQRAGQNIVNLLFRLSEDNARRNGCVHRGCQCNACGMVPIRGVRYRCANCADFDLCETCESQGVHIKTHIFYKIRVPAPPFGPRYMQPVWYTGDPDTCRRTLPRALMGKLSQETGFERPELEAFWEQWTFMANTEWREDPDELCIAMDRKTFERCLIPSGGSRHAAPNLIHDRMFAFYDSNGDDLIGFSEFLHGLSYRKRKDKLQTVFDGYDIDADGYVDRRDFLRMFRAYYVLYRQMHRDVLDGLEDQLLASTEAQQLVNSRQPLSSLFGREGRLPAADPSLRFQGKTYHPNGDVDVAEDHRPATANNRPDTAERYDILTSLFACDSTGNRLLQRGYVTGSDADENWRTVRRGSDADADHTYWVNLMDPPTTLEAIPAILSGERPPVETTDGEDHADDEGIETATEPVLSESAQRVLDVAKARAEAPKLEKRRHDMARQQLHERWKRREFFLDQEEGGVASEDWEGDADILTQVGKMADEAQASGTATPTSRKANGRKSVVPKDLPQVERDAGKEILYQVTQQAFNELLDFIFKPVEDLAMEASRTKALREKYRAEIDAIKLTEEEENLIRPPQESQQQEVLVPSIEKIIQDKSLDELLSATGYTVVSQTEEVVEEPRRAVELSHVVTIHEDEPAPAAAAEYRDPTMPQFRPNSASDRIPLQEVRPLQHQKQPAAQPEEPALETLRAWKRLNLAEHAAEKRGGWGRLQFDEFEQIYRLNESQGTRLDYLGSWIDFCIP